MKYQLTYWQENKTFLYCFTNEKHERNFKFLGISDQVLGQCIKEANSKMFSCCVNGIFAMKLTLFDNCELMQSFKIIARVRSFHSYQNTT